MLAQFDWLLAVESLTTVRLGIVPWRRPVPLLPRHGFCDQEAVLIETFDRELVSADSGELASCEEVFGNFERAAVFGVKR
ncbi:Scr1 family TA system antitoxin-like transcriptional regulator [Streptomyces cyaneofuscatus]|uniref:Scr1 family TA system antitoxin-like transcriptional regulator n=1 Tax=Streptomyces cyaneofuscatus TaxID=66883 RepID=UPI00345D222C